MSEGVLASPRNTLFVEDLWSGFKYGAQKLAQSKNTQDGFVKSCQLTLLAAQTYWHCSGTPVNPKIEKVFDTANTQYFFGLGKSAVMLIGRVRKDTTGNYQEIEDTLNNAIQDVCKCDQKTAKRIAFWSLKSTFDYPGYVDEKSLWDALNDKLIGSKIGKDQTINKQQAEDIINATTQNVKIAPNPMDKRVFQILQDIFWSLGDFQTILIFLREWGVDIAAVTRSMGEMPVFKFIADIAIDMVCAITFIAGYACALYLAIREMIFENTTVVERINSLMTALVAATEIVRNALTLCLIDRLAFLIWSLITKSIGVCQVFVKVTTTA